MQKIYLTLLLAITFNFAWSQSDNCSGAIALTNGACVTGSSFGFTQNIAGCVGNADDDAWYKFVASGTSHSLTVTGSATFDAVLQVFSGTCATLVSSGCVDNTFNGQAESFVASGLTIGSTYYVRVYHYFAGSGSSTFTLCLANPPAAPANDICGSAINLSVNAACINTSGTTFGATQSFAPCAGTANDDVWYSFSATNYTQTIQVAGSASFDGVVELYNGTCGTLSSMSCTDNTFSGGTETITASGLTPGVTYFFRVYDYYSTAGSTFSVCVSGTSIIAGSQPNDEPCNAIQIPAVTADCNNLVFSNVGATQTILPGSPGAVCENYNNATDTYGALSSGGFGATSKDVWFKITVPASGNIYITPQPNMGAGWISDGVMTLYRGACGALTTFTCSDDFDYPAGYNDMQPFIRALGLTPGETVYLRYWGFGATQGNFGFCVQSPTNDLCANALYICDINGYSATTSPAYNRDHPCNMRGNGELSGPTYNYSVNANPGGPFGAGGSWGTGSAINDVYIDRNSWVRFTAASPTVSLRVTVSECWGIGTNSITATPGTPKGVQMQIFSTTSACCGFTPVSDYKENASGSFVGGVSTYTVNANSLTVANDYYLMVDGWAGDICNYNIQAISGVALPAITAVPGTICAGQTTTLTAPSGATGYTWEPTGQNTQTISVSPGTQMTYTCFVGGVCGYKQTLTKTVFLYTTPTITFAVSNPTVCNGKSVTFTAGGASTYTWTGGITNGVAFSPTITNTYSVTATSVNGCTNTSVNTVTVHAIPTITPAGTNTICNGANTSLTVSGASTYTWLPSATLSPSTGSIVTASPISNTNYTINGTDAATTCTNSATYSVTVNAKPTVSLTATSNSICNGSSVTLTGGGTASPYTWTGGVTDGVAFNPTSTNTYTVTGTHAVTGCTNQAVKTITVIATPTITPAGTNTICFGSSTSLTAGGASTYTWSPSATLSPATGSIVTASPTTGILYTITGTANSCTSSATYSVTVNPKPTVSFTVSNSAICKGSSTTLNGTGANTYTWTNPVTNGSAFSPTSTASYTVTGTNTLTGCTNTAVATVTVNSIPTTTLSTTGTITCATPTINLNSTATATAGATYTWTAPGSSSIFGGTANNQNAIGQGAGTYTLNVLSAAGCTYSATIVANVNMTTPTASATGGTLTCTNTSTVLVGGPTSGVTYNWSGPGISGSTTSSNATVTAVGSYSLIATNIITGCSSTVAAVATVTNNLTTPTVSAGSNQMITCASPTVTLTGSATAGSSLNWSTGSTTNTTTASGPGFYTLTATNPTSGCSLTSTVQVSASPGSPDGTASTDSNSITCTNTSVAVSITSTSTPISILWTGPNITGSTTTPSTTVSQGGTYTVTITYTTTGCKSSYLVVVPTNTAAVVASASISPSASITCTTSTVTLGSNPQGPEFTYSWSGPTIISGGTTATPVVGATGNYSVTVTNTITGCTNTAGSAVVFVPTNTTAPLLSVSNNSITTTCGAPSTTVSATSNSDPNSTYTWTAPGTGTIDNISISNPTIGGSGVFTVAVTNTVNGCISAISTVTITPDVNTPTFNLSSGTATITCAIPSPNVSLTSTVSGVTYSWSPTPSSGITTASPTFTTTGNYTCIITATNGCSTATQVDVGLNTTAPDLTVTPSSSITCSSNTVVITSTVNPVSTYTWSGSGIQGSINSSSIIANSVGDYTLTVTDPVNGCITTTTSSVGTNTVAPTLTLTPTSTVITCSTSSSTITATPSTTDTPTWVTPSGASETNPVTATTSGNYIATIVDATNGCKTKDSINLIIDITPPNANAGAGVVMPCSLNSAILSGSSTTTDPVSYDWTGPNAGSITSATNIASPTVNSIGVYTLMVTNLVTGCTETATVNVTTDNVTADFTADLMTGDAPLTVNFTDASIGATSYTWSFGNGGTSTNQNPSTVFNTAGTYSVILIASSTLCSDTTSKIIIVEDGFTIEIPNVFTPNNDGINDAFHIKITGVKSAEGLIYNRWGQLLHSWDALNVSWDGKASNGEICPDATYYYLIKVIDKKDKEHIAPGYVLIIR